MRRMMANYGRPDVQKIAILLTDGEPNIEPERTVPEAEQAKREHIMLNVIGELRLNLNNNNNNKEYSL